MANIGIELKRLLTKLGGTPSKYDQTNELIHKITDLMNAGGGGLVVETEWDDAAYPADPRFKSTVLGADLRAAIASGQNVVVHIPGKETYGIGEMYFSPMLGLTNYSGQAEITYYIPYDKNNSMPYSNLMNGNDDNDGYVQFLVYTD